MPLVEDNHMVETLTSNGADHPFDQWILPRGARCGKDLLHPETVDASVEVRSGGIIKALKGRYGKKLIHQRCTLHKDRNIQRHLPKRYRKRAHHLFATALEQNSYKDAKKMLQEFERWLRGINESAADSLLEALEEVLTLHRLKVPALLHKSLHSTNPIESMFSMVRSCERNIKRYRNSKMRQRWLAAVLLHCERRFRRVKGYASIDTVVAAIDAIQRETEMPEAA